MKKNVLTIFIFVCKTIIGIFLAYAVVFSLIGTFSLLWIYGAVMNPMHQVEYLVDHNPKESAFMHQYKLVLKKKNRSDSLSQVFVPLGSISKTLRYAVLAAEDDGFYTHPGFDVEAMLGAYEYNKSHNKIARGGSTITQQLAKNLFLTNEKSFLRKIKELGYTVLLEKYLDKDRILELYLNYAQWGSTIFGCEAASLKYFKKPCSRLTLSESTRLAASLVSPERLNPLNENSGFMQKRIEVIANNLYKKHLLNDSAYTEAFGVSPPPKDSSPTSRSALP